MIGSPRIVAPRSHFGLTYVGLPRGRPGHWALRICDIVLQVRWTARPTPVHAAQHRVAAAALPYRAVRIGTIAALRLLRRIKARHRDCRCHPTLQ
ncbi:hypothetical protein [Burkholderia ambifaria]|uniref:hypothetical protein n=1 Tax=Burkholderia ambifaria TaxID=152480 RepID=UPI001E5B384E|nr:hypothetical protein [Burkholderia ambifaria]